MAESEPGDLRFDEDMVTADTSKPNEAKFLNGDNGSRSDSESGSSLSESCNESDSELVIDTNSRSESPNNIISDNGIDLTKVTNGFTTGNQFPNESDSYKGTNTTTAPLNLSLGSTNNQLKKNEPKFSNQQLIVALKSLIETCQNFSQDVNNVNDDINDNTNAIIPHMILTSGKLVNGIQQAQVLVPTNEGVITQPVLTIPLNNVNSSNQMVNLALSNGQMVTTSVANLQAMTKRQQTSLLSDFHVNNGKVPGLNGFKSHQRKFPDNDKSVFKENRQHHNQYTERKNGDFIGKSHLNCTLNELNASTNSSQDYSLLNHMNNNNIIKNHHDFSPSHTIPNSTNNLSPNSNSENHSTIDQVTINQIANKSVPNDIDLDDVKEFAKAFKARRMSLGLTQSQVGQALNIAEGSAYSQSAICSALASQMLCATQQLSNHPNQIFEKLDITPKSAQKIKPVLEKWIKDAEERYQGGQNHLNEFMGLEQSKKRKRRTSFTPQALELLNAHFERNTHPSGTEITGLAHQLGYDREVIRIWFCNKRQALKNTVRLMSKNIS